MKNRILLVLAIVCLFVCVFAVSVSAEEIDPNEGYYDKVYVDANGKEFPIYEKEGDTYYPLVWFAYDVTETNEETGETTVVETKYVKARWDDVCPYSAEPSQGRFNGLFYNYTDENKNTIVLNSSNAIVINLRGGVMNTTYNNSGISNGTNKTIKTIETSKSGYPYFSKLQAIYFPLSQTMVNGLSIGTLRVCDIDRNHPIGISFNHGCLQYSSIEEIFIPANSSFGNHSGGTNSQFKGCKKLKKVEFGGAFNDWLSGYFFDGCSALEEIIVPADTIFSPTSGGTTVNTNAFAGCSSLKRIYFMGNQAALQDVIDGTVSGGNSDFLNLTRISYAEYSALADKSGGKYIIFDCSPCLAYNGDVHTPTDDKTVLGDDMFSEMKVVCSCGVSGCSATVDYSTISPLFVDMGYSASTYGDGYSVAQGFFIKREAISQYMQYKDVEFGVVATVNESGSAIAPVLGASGVFDTKLDITKNDYIDIIITGIPDNTADVEDGDATVMNSEKKIVFCLYVTDGVSVWFLDNGITSTSVEGISYQTIIDKNK